MSLGRLPSLPFFALFLLLSLTACQPPQGLSITSETDEPHFRRGQQLVRSGRNQEALSAFLKVIEKRAETAPESHLEAGLLYLQHIKDPVAAIYHFRKYLELRPNSPQAELVRQRIEAATKEFARTLPAGPLENHIERLDLMELVQKLQNENLLLKQELAAQRQAAGSGTQVILNDFAQPAAKPAPAGAAAPRALPGAPPAAAAYRKHTVQPGETLFRLSTFYYGNGSKWPVIFEANRDVMKSETDVRIGMELKIP